MRRKDREITETAKIDEIILSCECCRLGFRDGERVYIVPLNFGYANENGKAIFYFHGAKEGRKIDLIEKNGYAAFELDTNHQVNTDEAACDFSFRFRSVIGEGPISMISDQEEKKKALLCIMDHYSEKKDWEFPEAMLKNTAVFRLEAENLACKEHL